jgi:hypothetical protein
MDMAIVSAFITNSFSHGFEKEAHAILNIVIKTFPNIQASAYNESLMPFLKDLAKGIALCSGRLITLTIQQLFNYALNLYLDRYVKQEPQQPHRMRAPLACTRQPICSPCIAINYFLQSSLVRVGKPNELRIPKDALGHADKHIAQLEKQDCMVQRLQGKDFTYLTLEKTLKHYNKRREEWEKRVHSAECEFRDFGEDVMRRVLGNAFEDIKKMKRVRLEPEGTVPLTPVPEPLPNYKEHKPRRTTNQADPHAPSLTAPQSSTEQSIVPMNEAENVAVATQDRNSVPQSSTERPTLPKNKEDHAAFPAQDNDTVYPSRTPTAPDRLPARQTQSSQPPQQQPVTKALLKTKGSPSQPKRPASPAPESDSRPEFDQTTGAVKARQWKRKKTAGMLLDEALSKFG